MSAESLYGIEQEFTEALKNGEFCVWYQPQVDMRTGVIRGAEALVRWQKKNGELIPPDQFVPDLEKEGVMPLLDEEVLRIVCGDICDAKQKRYSFCPVSVNLSRLHAGRKGISGILREITEEYGIGKGELSFEITETAKGPDDGERMPQLARYLQRKGFRIAMDDYGMGNSTLKLLQEIRFDILKLDRFFISRIGDPKAEVILSSTITMAEALGLEVIAEGVENREQIRFLLKHGCCFAQGYYYSRPLTKERYMMRRMERALLCAEDGAAGREETV